MLMHFVNNGFAVIMAQIPSTQEYDFFVEMMGTATYSVLYVVALAVLAACILAYKRIPVKNSYGNIDRV
jgi:mannose/fructose/N-acetylgalactosamine-specific phosphotransferase system component IIC